MTWNATELSHSTFTTLTWGNATTLGAKTTCALICLALTHIIFHALEKPTFNESRQSIWNVCLSIFTLVRPSVQLSYLKSVCLFVCLSGRPSIRLSVRLSVPQSVAPETGWTTRTDIPDRWILSVQLTIHPIESPSDDHIVRRMHRVDVRLCYGSSNTYYACEMRFSCILARGL